MASTDYAYRRLVNTLGPERVARAEFDRMVYARDVGPFPRSAKMRWRLYPDFVVLPQTAEEVSTVLKLSDESGLPLVPRGGGTSWHGGSVPNRGGVLLDMRRMNAVRAIDPAGRTITVEAGATWQEVQERVEKEGLTLPVLPTNAIASTVGGAINSGVAGFGGPRNGGLLDSLVDLEVVLPDGRILHTAPPGDAGGHFASLTPLFFGAEGTLGVVTAATLRLFPKPDVTKPVAYALDDLARAARFLRAILPSGVTPYHAALMDKEHFVFEQALRKDAPEPANIVLVCLQGTKDDVADSEKTLDALAEAAHAGKLDPKASADLWERRYTVYSARRLSRGLVVAPTVIPLARLDEAVAKARDLIRKLKLNGAIQAYLVDSACAILTPYVLADETAAAGGTAMGFSKKMGDAAFELDGHPMGLGMFYVFNLRPMHGRAARYTEATKTTFDPNKKLNGGKTIEIWTKYEFPGLRHMPPGRMAIQLNVAAGLRRLKPRPDRFVRRYEAEEGS